MDVTRDQLHRLVDIAAASQLNALYIAMSQFVPEDAPLPDEVEAIARAAQRGDYVSFDSAEDAAAYFGV